MSEIRVALRPMSEDDLELKVKWANDETVNDYIGFDDKVTLEGTRRWFAGQSADPTIILLTITADGVPIGYAKLIRSSEGDSGEYAGLAIGEPEYWGRGLGKAIVEQLLVIAFEREGWQRFWGYFPAWNDRSIGLHEKLGFRKVGEAEAKRYHPGKQREFTVYVLAMTRDEYAARAATS